MRYFSLDEFKCPCCDGLPSSGMSTRLLDLLDCLRCKVGVPVIVNSGYRCPSHNRNVGGVADSQHLLGTAADISASGITVDQLSDIAEVLGADGIGKYYRQGFVHVDVRGYYARWEE